MSTNYKSTTLVANRDRNEKNSVKGYLPSVLIGTALVLTIVLVTLFQQSVVMGIGLQSTIRVGAVALSPASSARERLHEKELVLAANAARAAMK